MKTLSIAVPSYNSEEYLNKCIESLLKGGERVEILIVNDGSTDGTKKIATLYEKKYPTIVKVINQENKGHGGAINSGVQWATGKYFKVVDSDDTLDEKALLEVLDTLDENDVDMLVTNYKYTHEDPNDDKTIRYNTPFKKNKVLTWKNVRFFKVEQYLTIHSVIYKTQCVRDSKIKLPEHIFYEDNVFVYGVLPYVKKLMYMDVVLYNYTIGREGQSVQEEVIVKRYKHQLLASKLLFTSHHLEDIKERKLKKYMYHECVMLLGIASVFARLNKTEEAEEELEKMWKECEAFDYKLAQKIKKRSITMLVNIEGEKGRDIGIMMYTIARKLVRFN